VVSDDQRGLAVRKPRFPHLQPALLPRQTRTSAPLIQIFESLKSPFRCEKRVYVVVIVIALRGLTGSESLLREECEL
jgi:hypothetical protein